MDSGNTGEMTLAFSLTALERLEDPREAFTEATEWSKYVGVVSGRPQHVAAKFTRDHQLPKHFLPRPTGEKKRTLEDVRSVSSEYEETERYVFVGTSTTDREIAGETDWEYVPLEEASKAAGWEVALDRSESTSGPQVEEDHRDDWP